MLPNRLLGSIAATVGGVAGYLPCDWWRKKRSPQIPVPRIAAAPRPRILQWFELEATFSDSDRCAIPQQAFAIGGDEVRHLAALPDVAV
jgi:hypothetical protein